MELIQSLRRECPFMFFICALNLSMLITQLVLALAFPQVAQQIMPAILMVVVMNVVSAVVLGFEYRSKLSVKLAQNQGKDDDQS